MKQTRLMSLFEAIANVLVGYGIAVLTQLIVFPWFGLPARIGMRWHLARSSPGSA